MLDHILYQIQFIQPEIEETTVNRNHVKDTHLKQ